MVLISFTEAYPRNTLEHGGELARFSGVGPQVERITIFVMAALGESIGYSAISGTLT